MPQLLPDFIRTKESSILDAFAVYEIINNKTKENISIKFDLNVYPNPTNDQITINFPDYTAKSNSQYSIYSIDGKLLTGQPITAISTDVSILDYPAGVYFIKVKDEQTIIIKKFIKQ